MELVTCARPYARAVFDYAKQANQLAEWARMLSICTSVASTSNVNSLLGNPALTGIQQAKVFLTLCEGSLSREVENFINILSENKRITLLPHIELLFKQLKAEEESSQDVTIISALPLTQEQLEELRKKVGVRLNRSIKLTAKIDKSLIGGVIIKAGDLVIDGSIRARLIKLADAMVS